MSRKHKFFKNKPWKKFKKGSFNKKFNKGNYQSFLEEDNPSVIITIIIDF